MSTFNILDQSSCKSRIKRIKSLGARLQSEIHLVGVSALAHLRDHGDWTIATSLLEALPNGQRVKALAHWMNHFSNGAATFSHKGGAAGWACKLIKNRTPEMFDIDGAWKVSFADFTKEKDPKTLGVKEVLAYLKRKANDDGEVNGVPRVSDEARELFASLYNIATDKVAEMSKA